MSRTSSMPLRDHEGHVFRRVKDMAAYWGLYPELLSARYRSGLSLKECLTKPCRKQQNPGERKRAAMTIWEIISAVRKREQGNGIKTQI